MASESVVKRVAQAIMSVNEYKGSQEEYYERLARAAIAAIREPTMAMLEAGHVASRNVQFDVLLDDVYPRERATYCAMIDAALKPDI